MKLYTTPLIGMLCSALVIGNSYATGTFVASKSYVDNAIQDVTSTTATATNSNGTITIAQGDNEHVPTTKAVTDGLTAINTKLTSVASTANNAANKNLTNLSSTGKSNIAAEGTFDINTQYADGTVGQVIKHNIVDIDTLYDSRLYQKTSTVAWNEANTNSQNADERDVAARYANAQDRDKLIPSVAAVDVRVDSAVKNVIANQGTYNGTWKSNDFLANDPTAATQSGSNLGDTYGHEDEFVPTLAAVEARVQEVEKNVMGLANAKVEDQIVDNVTDKAPSQNAVHDALANKADKTTVQDKLGGSTYNGKVVTATSTAGNVTYTEIESTPTASSTKLITSGGVQTALSNKQDKLGGTADAGKVVTATSTAGNVTYTEIESTPTANSTKLVTSGGVQAAISNATSSQLKTSDKDSTNVVTSTNTSKIPTVSGVQAGIAKQGSATVDWTAVTDSTSGASAQLKDAKTNQDNYIPTVKAVETRIKTTETSLSANINAKEDKTNKVTSIGSSNTDTQYPSAKAVYDVTSTLNTVKQTKNDSKVEGTKGTDFHYITAGNAVGNNLKALDNQIKTNADNIGNRTVTLDNTTGTASITDGTNTANVYTKTQTDTELAKKVVKNTDITASTKNSVVTYDAQGLVTGGFQLENGGIKSIENADSATLCSTTNPCILTYLGGTGAAADYRWTPMDEGSETIPAKPAS